MTFRPRQGDSVITPDGVGVVTELIGLSTGNGAVVCLTENPTPDGSAPSIYELDVLTEGPPIPPFSEGEFIRVPGGHPGRVVEVEAEGVLCVYEIDRPRRQTVSKQGFFPPWQLYLSNLLGR